MNETQLKYIFFHIPKTGGTTVLHMLPGGTPAEKGRFHNVNSYCLREDLSPEMMKEVVKKRYASKLWHFTIRQHLDIGIFTQSEINDCFSFAFVRNPYDRMVSQYLYRCRIDENFRKTYTNFDDFMVFVGRVHDEATRTPSILSGFMSNHLIEQNRWVFENSVQIRHVFRFENFEQDLKKVMAFLEIDPSKQIGHYKKSKRTKEYKAYYSHTSREAVERIYGEDCRLFGYKY